MTSAMQRHRWARIVVALVGIGILGISGVPAAVSQTPPGEQTYNACHRNDGEKLVRIVKSSAECGTHETGFQFGQGAPGEPGPAGPPATIGAGTEVEAREVRIGDAELLVMRAHDFATLRPGVFFAIATMTFRPLSGEHVGVSCRFTTTPESAGPDLALFNDGPYVSATMMDQFGIAHEPVPEIGVLCRSSLVPPRPMELVRGKLWVKQLDVDLGG